MPKTLTSDDLAALSKGSIVVTLGDTTLSFEQDDSIVSSQVWNSLVGSVTEGFDIFFTPTQKNGAPTLPENSQFWLQQNASTREVCGVFPSGTVCLTNDSNGRQSEFTDASNGNVTGYTLEKKTEMEQAGASCTVYSTNVKCYGLDMYCSINSGGRVSCYTSDNYHRCDSSNGCN